VPKDSSELRLTQLPPASIKQQASMHLGETQIESFASPKPGRPSLRATRVAFCQTGLKLPNTQKQSKPWER
jgi:hypothetical protein